MDTPISAYDDTPARGPLLILDPGDPARMAA